MSVSYNVIGGGSPSASPSLWYTYLGTSGTAQTVTTTPTSVWSDYGTVWDFVQTTTSPPGLTSERWAANGALSGTSTAGSTVSLTLYHQYLQTLSYSVSNGGSPSAPTATGSQFGSPYPVTLTKTPEGIWFDASASIALRTPILDLSNNQYTPSMTSIQTTQSHTIIVVYSPVIAATNTTTSSSSSSSSTTSSGPVGAGLPWWIWLAVLGGIGVIAVGGFLAYRLTRRPGEKLEGPGVLSPAGGTAGAGPGAGPGGGPGSGPGGTPGGVGSKPGEDVPYAPPPEVPYGTDAGCSLSSSWVHKSLELGLLPHGSKKAPYTFSTPPDEPVPLKASVTDFHILVQRCSCPGITGDQSIQLIGMVAKSRISWLIVQGEGGFVDQNGGSQSQADGGDEVLFQPAPIDSKSGLKLRTVKIQVEAIHDDPSKPPEHEKVRSYVTIEISRKIAPLGGGKASNDEYFYNYWVEDGKNIYIPEPKEVTGDCTPGHTWSQAEEIEGQIYKAPLTCNPGDFVRLGAMGTDKDTLMLTCAPSGTVCKRPSVPSGSEPSDPLTYTWMADKGEFPLEKLYEKVHGRQDWSASRESGEVVGREPGQVVVWHAPEEDCSAKITLLMTDSGREFPDKPKELIAWIKVGNPVVSPPVTPPPPAVPVPQTHEKEEGACDLLAKEKDSPLDMDVDADEGLPDGTKGKIEEHIKQRQGWDPELLGVSVAVSDGAAVGGSVDAGAKIRILGGEIAKLDRTREIWSSVKGSTDISLEFEAAADSKTAVSAALLTAMKAKAAVLKVPTEWWEFVEDAEVMKKVIEVFVEEVEANKLILGETKELIEELKKLTTLTGFKLFMKNLPKEFAGSISKHLIAIIIEKVGNWLFVNAHVEVETEGEMTFEVGNCGENTIEAQASRELEIKSGELEEPFDKEFERVGFKKGLASCSATKGLEIKIEGEAKKVRGKAYWGGEGNAYIDSLWAAAWVGACVPREGEEHIQTGFKFNALFTVPDETLRQYDLVDGAVIRKMIVGWMETELQDMLDDAAIQSPLDDPKVAELRLKDILAEWFKAVQEKWGIFTPGL
jgi:hypothetical protein